ncbi:TetR/AcrR family transcriptional regulator [Maridesulfovibrio sp. FT414]|uniref:TetR/AcrR family transcriptional regulator n=1 Tax=Maridesulfovibrio sp. FT414 TaxID=2979469 RepID=UPI003D80728F
MSDQNTKKRILKAAGKEFFTKGFKAATVRDICAEADANVAAVNYHFGDKRKLYLQVLNMWMNEMMSHLSTQEEQFLSLSPKEKLRIYVHNELRALCIFDDPEKKRKRKIRLLLEEYVSEDCDPELFKCHDIVEEKVLFPLVREILHPLEDSHILEQACMAASGVLVHHFLAIIHYPEGEIESEDKLEFLTDFYTNFILGSLKGIKDKYHV